VFPAPESIDGFEDCTARIESPCQWVDTIGTISLHPALKSLAVLDTRPGAVTMSFFDFDTSRHNPAAAGFSQAHNPFAGLSNREDEGDALEFEETYDGLGDQLQETGDAFNDDTFGDTSGPGTGAVGKDFDFFSSTAQVANAIEEEHVRFTRQHPAPRAPQAASQAPAYAIPQSSAAGSSSYGYYPQPAAYKPARTGYEKYSTASRRAAGRCGSLGCCAEEAAASTSSCCLASSRARLDGTQPEDTQLGGG